MEMAAVRDLRRYVFRRKLRSLVHRHVRGSLGEGQPRRPAAGRPGSCGIPGQPSAACHAEG